LNEEGFLQDGSALRFGHRLEAAFVGGPGHLGHTVLRPCIFELPAIFRRFARSEQGESGACPLRPQHLQILPGLPAVAGPERRSAGAQSGAEPAPPSASGRERSPQSTGIPQSSNGLEPRSDLRPRREGFELPMTRVASTSEPRAQHPPHPTSRIPASQDR
jgi:hypothetical protein